MFKSVRRAGGSRVRRNWKKRRKILKVHVLPTLMSLGNLLCGVASISYALTAASGVDQSDYAMYLAGMFIFFAMACDLLDGRLARLTGGESRFGAELDSLADLVSFGVAPAVFVRAMTSDLVLPHRYGWALVGIYVAFAAVRLARYNVEKDSKPEQTFSGLPVPAAAGAVMSLGLVAVSLQHFELKGTLPPAAARALVAGLPVYMLVLGCLMVSRVRYAHVGRLLLAGKKSFAHLAALLLVLVLAFMQLELTLALGFTVYVATGLVMAASARFSRAASPLEPESRADSEPDSAP